MLVDLVEHHVRFPELLACVKRAVGLHDLQALLLGAQRRGGAGVVPAQKLGDLHARLGVELVDFRADAQLGGFKCAGVPDAAVDEPRARARDLDEVLAAHVVAHVPVLVVQAAVHGLDHEVLPVPHLDAFHGAAHDGGKVERGGAGDGARGGRRRQVGRRFREDAAHRCASSHSLSSGKVSS